MRSTVFSGLSLLLLIPFAGHSQSLVSAFSFDNRLWGYVDQSGTEIIPPKYTKPTEVSLNGNACVYDPAVRKFKLINMNGSEIPTDYPNFEVVDFMGYKEQGFVDDYIRINVKGKQGVLDKKGKTVHAPEYDKVTNFFGDFAFATKGSTWFVLKNNGTKIEIPGKIKDVKKYREGLAPFVTSDDKFGFMNDRGEIVIPAEYEGAGYFSSGLAWVRNAEKKIGFIDKTGKLVIPFNYDMAKEFDANIERTVAKIGEQFVILKKDGTEIKVDGAVKVKDFFDGVAEALSGEKWGFIDKDGKWIVEPKYEKLQYYVNGYGRIRLNGVWGVVDKQGTVVIEPKYARIEEFIDGRAAFIPDGSQGWGFIDPAGTIIVKPTYETVRNFHNGLARVKKGEFWGTVDVNGNEVIKPEKFRRLNDFSEVK